MTAHDKTRPDRIVAFVASFEVEYGHPPSIREVMSSVGLVSTATVHYHVTRLVKAERLYRCKCGCGRVSAFVPGVLAETAA